MKKNLKISGKLLLSFGGISTVIILLSALALASLGSLNRIITEYDEKILLSSNGIWDIRCKMIKVELYISEAISAAIDSEIQSALQLVVNEREALQNAIEEYKKIDNTKSGLIEEYERKLSAAGVYRQKITNILNQPRTEKNIKEALNIYRTQYSPAYLDANDTLVNLEKEVNALSMSQHVKADATWVATKSLVFFTASFAVFFSVMMGLLLRKSILMPVRELEKAAKDMAEGSLNTSITYQSQDELGILANSFRASERTIRSYIQDIDRAMKEMAKGNFDLEPTQPFIGDYKQIEESISHMIENISLRFQQIDVAANQVSSGADQISDSAQALAQGATEQATEIEQLLAAVNSVSKNFDINARQTQQASTLAAEATNAIQSSNQYMQQLIVSINNVNTMSRDISKITKMIEDIAFQTNILSLNAAVEAARAGSSGKGFAVVANEVRNLAVKSAEAAKMTSDLIDKSVEVIDASVVQTESTANLLDSAVHSVMDTMTIISEISAETTNQIQVIQQINTGLDHISSVVQTNSANSEESAASSEELASQAAVLKDITSSFQIKKL